MISSLETSFRALEIASQQAIPGWYWDVSIGWYYLDELGNRHLGDPYTGLLFVPLGFYPENINDAKVIRSDAPINILEGESVKVDFSFKWSGEARDIVFVIGNCHKVPTGIPPYVYDIGDSAEVTVRVDASAEPVTYTGSGTFIFYAGVHTKPHLFINPQDVSPESDTIYLNAFTKVTGEFKDLVITQYEKV